MRWPLVRRSRLDALENLTGVYRCGSCGFLIPLGYAHQKDNGGPCKVICTTANGSSVAPHDGGAI